MIRKSLVLLSLLLLVLITASSNVYDPSREQKPGRKGAKVNADESAAQARLKNGADANTKNKRRYHSADERGSRRSNCLCARTFGKRC